MTDATATFTRPRDFWRCGKCDARRMYKNLKVVTYENGLTDRVCPAPARSGGTGACDSADVFPVHDGGWPTATKLANQKRKGPSCVIDDYY